uniref:Uncharacterized protein n=1 Tax=Panagrellus redivivus TaxID=6233 RepID=A0A7E4VZD2_PANRE
MDPTEAISMSHQHPTGSAGTAPAKQSRQLYANFARMFASTPRHQCWPVFSQLQRHLSTSTSLVGTFC